MAETDPEALESQIERTRAELAVTVDAIADRVSPKRVVERSVAKIKTTAGELVETAREKVVGVAYPAKQADPGLYGDDGWQDESPAASLAPILIGVGAVVVIGAVIAIWRRRRR